MKNENNFTRKVLINNPWIESKEDGPTSRLPTWAELAAEYSAEKAALAAAKAEGAKRPKTGRGRR